jgi:hypothetical protein
MHAKFLSQAKQRRENRETEMFKNTTAAIDTDVNMIDYSSGVQVYRGTLRFYVAVPASAKNGGVRAIVGADTLNEALALGEALVPQYRTKMDRIHARALKMNAAH